MILRSLKSILKGALVQETAPQPFSGVGTVFLSDVVNFEIPDDGIDPVTLATEMNTTFAGTHDTIKPGFPIFALQDNVIDLH